MNSSATQAKEDSAKQAQSKADERRHNAAKAVKTTEPLIERVEQKLAEKWITF
ncbi:MAG: hypothetical protein KZQ88_01325 [Candidatus Thiodiazotropha sp. (ex Dulcina madagascariensis)]|nr:hypothetical protein [Candidatus Thiodiazotropha sp. (ex Dulcina madagascariensis)]MCU7925679.1 hypothetical protein [Candidatus Thiodiazotropha sp. (ex Dulcina madagascariensis)]